MLKFWTLPSLLYTAARKACRRLASAFGKERQKRNFLIPEGRVPDIYENRRIVAIAGTATFLYYLRILRDSFPDDDRFRFAWGGFQASGLRSLFVFPDLLKKRNLLVAMENPIIGRQYFDRMETRDKGYFRIALYDSALFHRGIFNLPHQANSTRFHSILKATNSRIRPYRKRGNHILYALQVPRDRSLVGLDIFTAAQYDLVALRTHTSRKIIVTVSPVMVQKLWAIKRLRNESLQNYFYLKKLCETLDIEIYDNFKTQEEDSSQFFKDCWCVVCHSSGVAVEAIMAGVPAITLHPASFVYPICSHDLSEVENPKMADRIAWFSRLAYCQWTLAEIEGGEVWRHFQATSERLLEKR